MDYITIPEATKMWSITPRAIRYHIAAGRIDGVEQKGKMWLIPASTPKPKDLRFSFNRKDDNGEV
jgi:hypothetical protein